MADVFPQTSSFRLHTSDVAVVEAEKTAVILSEHYPAYLWLAAGGLFELTADKLFPLHHRRIVLFPDTDPNLTAYTRWYEVAREARRLYGCNITVSPLLKKVLKSCSPLQKNTIIGQSQTTPCPDVVPLYSLRQVSQGMALSTRANVIFKVFRRHLRLVPMIL